MSDTKKIVDNFFDSLEVEAKELYAGNENFIAGHQIGYLRAMLRYALTNPNGVENTIEHIKKYYPSK